MAEEETLGLGEDVDARVRTKGRHRETADVGSNGSMRLNNASSVISGVLPAKCPRKMRNQASGSSSQNFGSFGPSADEVEDAVAAETAAASIC